MRRNVRSFGHDPIATATATAGRRPRPCDSCRRRKRRCYLHPGELACQLCRSIGAAACTFTESDSAIAEPATATGSRKRSAAGVLESSSIKRLERAHDFNDDNGPTVPIRTTKVIDDYDALRGPSLLKKNLGLQQQRYLRYVGPCDELEPRLFDYCSFDERDESQLPDGTSIRKVSADAHFVLTPYGRTSIRAEEFDELDAIEKLVAPYGSNLVRLFFEFVHPSFPILDQKTFLEKYERTHREFSPPCLAGIYMLALHWWHYDRELSSRPKPDIDALERLAKQALQGVVHRPKLSTLQGGLLILQHRPTGQGTWALSCQMLAVGQELGIHLDCDAWRIPPWEKSLRRRLGWALYMLDKWMAWSHGRPSHIFDDEWVLEELRDDDLAEEGPDAHGGRQASSSATLRPFQHMSSLSKIMADIMRLFHSPSAAKRGLSDPRPLLEAAKPVQIRLKAWYQCLSDQAALLQPKNPNPIPATVQLAYFAAEITLHRAILSSLTGRFCDPFIVQVCRRAARERITGAIQLVQSFQVDQLQSFWYFPSGRALVCIGTFTALLYATSRSVEEAVFYKSSLEDYCWTLRTLSRSLGHFEYAVQRLDASLWHLEQISPEDIAHGVDSERMGTPEPEHEREHDASELHVRRDEDCSQQPNHPASTGQDRAEQHQADDREGTWPEANGDGDGSGGGGGGGDSSNGLALANTTTHEAGSGGGPGGGSDQFLNWVDITFPSPEMLSNTNGVSGSGGNGTHAVDNSNRDLLYHWQRYGMDFFGRDWTHHTNEEAAMGSSAGGGAGAGAGGGAGGGGGGMFWSFNQSLDGS